MTEPIPPESKPRILIASVIRKPPVVLAGFLHCLSWQRLRNASVQYLFVPNFNATDPFRADAMKILDASGARIALNVEAPQGDYADGERTRIWGQSAFERMAKIKDDILDIAVKERFDAVWLIDADVMCDPMTLQTMLDADAPIVSSVYWTQWQRPKEGDAQFQHAGPQVWLTGSYGMSGRGWTEPDFRRALIDRQRVQVWGLGACTLIRRDVLVKGVRFAKTAQLAPGPMSEGEDRAFCHNATVRHVPMFADSWSDVYHAYHVDEYGKIPDAVKALDRPMDAKPEQGWLISATLRNLEIPQAPPQYLRGRLGNLPVLPEIEHAIAQLLPGESRVLQVHFPVHWPEEQLRLKSCTIQVSLNDCKPFRLAPVIDRELFYSEPTGRTVDQTTLTQDQNAAMAAEGKAA